MSGRGPGRGGAGARVLLVLLTLLVAGVGSATFFALTDDAPPGDTAGGGAGDGLVTANLPSGGGPAAGGAGTKRPVKPSHAPAVAGSGAVRGQVRLFKTKEPVAGIALALRPPDGAALAATTADDGTFAFAQVPAGAGWELRGGRDGFAPLEITGLDVAPDQDVDVGVLWLAVPVDLPAAVVDTTGRPVEGAEVAAFATGRTLPEAEDEWSAELREQRTLALVSDPRPSRTAKTDAAGRAVVKGLMPGAYRAVASAPSLASASRSDLVLVPDGRPEPVRFVLGPAHALEGTVLDEKGAPVAKARLVAARQAGWLPSLDKAAADTGEDGAYRIEGLAAGPYLLYLARAGAPLLQVGQIGVPETTRFDVRLRPGGTIRGRVTDEDGRPVAAAEIHASMQHVWSPMAARTDKEGAFELKDVPAGPLGYFRVSAAGFVPFPDPAAQQQGSGESLREGQVMVRDVVLRRGATVAFRVEGEGAGPVEGAAVELHLASMWGASSAWKATTDAKGAAQVTGLLAGEYLAVVKAEGWVQPGLPPLWRDARHAPTAFPAAYRVSVGPEGAPATTIRLARGTAVAGRVRTSSGRPAPGCVVSIEGVRSDFPTFTDADGRFRIETVPALRRAVAKAVSPTGAAGRSEPFATVTPGAAEQVEIALEDPGRVTGTVATRDGRAPRGAFVRMLPGEVGADDVWSWRRADAAERYPVGADGAFEVPAAPVGQVSVRVDAEGYLPDARTVSVAAGVETGGVALVLGTPREVRGRVESPQGAPVAGATVQAWWQGRSDGQPGQFAPGLSGMPIARSGADGRFTVRGMTDGNVHLFVTAPGYAEGVGVPTSTEAGEVLVVLKNGKPITGVVKDPEGRPFPGVPVSAERVDRQTERTWGWWGSQTAYTAPDGTFELRDVAEGNYRLRVSGNWQWGREVNVEDTVKEGVSAGDRDVEIVVRPGLTIDGRLVDREKRPVRVGWVYAQAQAGPEGNWGAQRWVQVRSDGTFRVSGLKAGTHTLQAYGAFKPKAQEGVAAGARDVEVQVEDAWVVGGTVVDERGLSVREFGLQVRREGTTGWTWADFVGLGDGAFVVTGLDEAPYDLQVTVEGYAPAVTAGVAAGRRDVELRVAKGLEMAGTLVDAGGRGLAGVRVNVQSTRIADGAPPVALDAETDANGRFRVAGLLAGAYRVIAWPPDAAPVVRRDVAAGTDDLKLVAVPGTTVQGVVVDAAGLGIANARVSLLTEDDVRLVRVTADAEGAFEMKHVPEGGRWKLLVHVFGGGRRVEHRHEPLVESGATDVRIEVK